MSENVKNPFANIRVYPNQKIDKMRDNVLGISDITGGITAITNLFKEKVTPELQQQKAGVWYEMLATFIKNQSMTGAALGSMYKGRLPFKQNSTKDRFISEQLTGKSREYIINHLVTKINDELSKGGLPTLQKSEILAGMGYNVTPVKVKDVVSGKQPIVKRGLPTISTPKGTQEIKTISTKPDKRFDVVKPLAPTMKTALQTKGVSPSSNIEVLTNQFYNEIVRKDQPNNFNGRNILPELNTFDFPANYADEAIDAVITAVVQYIRNLKEKKKQGGTLSNTQAIIVKGTEKTEEIIETRAKEAAAQKVGSDILFGGKWMWIIGGIIAVILVIIVAVRR